MNRLFLPFLLTALLLSCSHDRQPDTDRTYALLERVAELNAGGDKQAALLTADSALALTPPDSTRCYLLCEKAVALTDMGRLPEAISTGREAAALAEDIGDVEATLNMRGMLGIAYRRTGHADSALVEYGKGIEMAVREKNTEYEIYLDNCVTVLYSESGRFEEALQYARKAEQAALVACDTIERLSAIANVGGILLRQKQYAKALDAVLPTWQDVQKADYNVLTLKYLSVILSACSMLGDDARMAFFLHQADQAMQGVSPTSAGVLGIVEAKARYMGRQGRYAEQLALIDSLLAANTVNRAMPLERLLSEKAQCLARLGRTDEAMTTMSAAYALLDSVKQSDIERSMSEFTVKYASLEKNLRLEQARRKNVQLENRSLWLAVAVAILAVAVGVMLYRRKLARQRAELNERRSYISGLESERERLAKELHDGICNDLLATTMLLADSPQRAEEQLRSVWKDVRSLSHALMPPRFDRTTLAEAVRAYVGAVAGEEGHEVQLTVDETFDWQRLPQHTAYEVYRIVQEATANAVRHGGTSATMLSLLVQHDVLTVTVSNTTDAARTAPSEGGIGSDTMLRRASSIGATLTTSCANGAFLLRLTCPI